MQAVDHKSVSKDEDDSYVHEINRGNDYNAWTQKLEVSYGGRVLECENSSWCNNVTYSDSKRCISDLPLALSKNRVFSTKKKYFFNILGTFTLNLKCKQKK